MAIETRPLSPSFATEIVGIDLSEPISNATLDAVWSAIDRYAVVVFRNQRLSDAQLRDFSARFGPLEIGRAAARPGRRRLEIPQIGDISNLDVDNNVRRARRPAPARQSRQPAVAHRRVVHAGARRPRDAACRCVAAALTVRQRRDRVRRHARRLRCAARQHASRRSTTWSWNTTSSGRAARSASPNSRRGEREQYPPSPQRLVRLHPGSKRKTLYLSAHASHIVGWPVADGRLLLWDLTAHATQRQFVYSHTWRVGDLVIWDNRCTMHRGRPHEESQPRDLRRATTLDTSSTLDQAA